MLGEFYLELSRAAAAPIEALMAPPASSQSTQAQQFLAALGPDHSIEGERYRVLLSQAERMRLSLMMLGRLRIRIAREGADLEESSRLDRYLEIVTRMLASIGNGLLAGEAVKAAAGCLAELHALAEFSPDSSGDPSAMAAMIRDVRYQMDALTGQLRSAVDMASHTTPEGMDAFEQREGQVPWSLRLIGTFAILRANLSLESAACRHAIRLAVCVALGDAISRSLGFGRYYWLPMTVAIVLKPDFSTTFSRGVSAAYRNIRGPGAGHVLFHLLPQGMGLDVSPVFAFMFMLRCFGGANYGIFVVGVTGLVVSLFALTGTAPGALIAARGWNTAIGGTIALLAYWLWPTWERHQVPEALAKLLDAYGITSM